MSLALAAATTAVGGGGGSGGAMAACEKAKTEYHRCLNNSGRRSWKCQEEEQRLRLCESTAGRSFCIDETKALIDCGRRPDKTGCAKQFVAMRECNRLDGPMIVEKDGKYIAPLPTSSSLDDGAAAVSGRGVVICDSSPPKRSDLTLANEVERLRKALATKGLDADGHGSVYKWDSLRSRPGH